MNLGHRFFVVNGDSCTRLSQKLFNDFFHRELPVLGKYAGTMLVVASAIYELSGRRPHRVVRIDVYRLKVTPEGSIDRQYLAEGMRLAMDRGFSTATRTAAAKSKSNVVDAKGLFDERRWKQHHPEISGPILKLILADLFGAA